MLEVKNIKKSFADNIILKNISFTAHDGELCVITGQNGAGKSTLFSILLGSLMPDSGEIILNGINISKLEIIKKAKDIAILVQDPKNSSISFMTVLENFLLSFLKNRSIDIKNAYSKSREREIENILSMLGPKYELLLHRKMGDLSGGQRQIIAFLMATVEKPKILLLDEPTAALDEESTFLLMDLIKNLIKKWQVPALMISHDKELNQKYADKILPIEHGVLGVIKA